MRLSKVVLGALALFIVPGISGAATIEIPGDYATIQAGIDEAGAGDTVLVADGTYMGDGNRELDFGGVDIVLRSVNGPAATVIDPQADPSEYYRVFDLHSGETELSVIEGFTIIGGRNLSAYAIRLESASPAIRNCVVTGPATGGGNRAVVLKEGSSPIFIDTEFRENIAWGGVYDGGAVHADPGCHPTFVSCVFEDNSHYNSFDPYSLYGYGGAIYCMGSVIIEDCEFLDNSSGAWGGAVYITEEGEGTISGCNFVSNRSGYGGGAVYCRGRVTVEDCVFETNEVSGGPGQGFDPGSPGSGAAICSVGELLLSGSVFRANVAHVGGALLCRENSLVTQCVFWENLAEHHARYYGGGAVFVSEGIIPPVFTNCTFCGNKSGLGGGIRTYEDASAVFDNCIIAFNFGGWGFLGTGEFTCSDIFANYGGDWVGEIADQLGVNGNISANPRFCDHEMGDFYLYGCSPCAPAQQPECGLIGALDVGCGPSATVQTTWGLIKSTFRVSGE